MYVKNVGKSSFWQQLETLSEETYSKMENMITDPTFIARYEWLKSSKEGGKLPER